MDFYRGTIPIIGDQPDAMRLAFPSLKGIGSEGVGYGYVPRDFAKYPKEMFQSPSEMKLYSESEWDALYDEQEANKSSLEHLYLSGPNGGPMFINLDQNGHGYCWSYSTGQAIMFDRLRANLPMVRINPHATAAIIKHGADEGGWCGLSAQFAREHGYAVEGSGPGLWPLHSRSLSNDTPELRANMALHKVTEDWVDLTREVYDQNIAPQGIATCHFNNLPVPIDCPWWGHSIVSIRTVRIEKGRWGRLILNSWANWGRFGLAVLEGSKLEIMGAICVRSTVPSDK